MAVLGIEACVPVSNAENSLHAVVVGQLEKAGANDVVEARREPPAGDERRRGLRWIEEDLTARASLLER